MRAMCMNVMESSPCDNKTLEEMQNSFLMIFQESSIPRLRTTSGTSCHSLTTIVFD